jgi:hypothetical protein
MLRFLFGVVLGIVLTLYVQAKGDMILRGVGIDPQTLHKQVKVIRELAHTILDKDTAEEERGGAGSGHAGRDAPSHR